MWGDPLMFTCRTNFTINTCMFIYLENQDYVLLLESPKPFLLRFDMCYKQPKTATSTLILNKTSLACYESEVELLNMISLY